MLNNLKKKSKCAKLHGCVIVGVGATWHMRSAIQHFWSAIRHFWSVEWHLAMPRHFHHGEPTPHAFAMCISHFRIF